MLCLTLDLKLFSSGIGSPYKSKSGIGLKSLKIRIIIIIHEKADSVISHSWCQQVHHKYINISFFTGSDTHTHTHTHTYFTLML